MKIGTQIAGPDRALLSGAVEDLDTVFERLAGVGYDGVSSPGTRPTTPRTNPSTRTTG